MPFLGEIRVFAGTKPPTGWTFCQGQLLPVGSQTALFSVLSTTYGGNGTSDFALPDLQGRLPVGVGRGPGLTERTLGETGGEAGVTLTPAQLPVHHHPVHALAQPATQASPAAALFADTPTLKFNPAPTGADALADGVVDPALQEYHKATQPHSNLMGGLPLHYILCLVGTYPSPTGNETADAYLGEVRLFAGTKGVGGWGPCDGRLLAVSQYPDLFSVLGTQFGGDGQTTFGLPDFRSRVPVCAGPTRRVGGRGGQEAVTLTSNQIPVHTHAMRATTADATTASPVGGLPAVAPDKSAQYRAVQHDEPIAGFSVDALTMDGGAAHPNVQPFLGLQFLVALHGAYPSRS